MNINKVKINKMVLLGILLILFAMCIYFLQGIDQFIRPFTKPILMGSSKGKDVLFFALFGFTLILSTLSNNRKIDNWITSLNIQDKYKNCQFYLKLSLILFLFIAIAGLIVEIYLRYSLGIDVFTIFVAMDPNLTTSSIYHSHLYKSIFGVIVGNILTYIPSGINTGSSLDVYTPTIVNYLFILIPINYILMIFSLQKRHPVLQFFLAFIFTLAIIGIIDGGFFATPTLGGIYGMLIYIFNQKPLHIILYYLLNIPKKSRTEIKKDIANVAYVSLDIVGNDILRGSDKRLKYIKRISKEAIPHIAIILIILLRITMSLYGSSTDSYELVIENAEDVDLSDYNITEIKVDGNRTTITLSNEYNEMGLLNKLGKSLDGKCDWFSLSMNAYSYFDDGKYVFS